MLAVPPAGRLPLPRPTCPGTRPVPRLRPTERDAARVVGAPGQRLVQPPPRRQTLPAAQLHHEADNLVAAALVLAGAALLCSDAALVNKRARGPAQAETRLAFNKCGLPSGAWKESSMTTLQTWAPRTMFKRGTCCSNFAPMPAVARKMSASARAGALWR